MPDAEEIFRLISLFYSTNYCCILHKFREEKDEADRGVLRQRYGSQATVRDVEGTANGRPPRGASPLRFLPDIRTAQRFKFKLATSQNSH
jgi:hypothetical protein